MGQPVLLVVTEFLVFGFMVVWHVFCPWGRDRDGVGVEMRWGYFKSRFVGPHFLILHGSVLGVFSIHGSSVYEVLSVSF